VEARTGEPSILFYPKKKVRWHLLPVSRESKGAGRKEGDGTKGTCLQIPESHSPLETEVNR
jgi:hypothetical protein